MYIQVLESERQARKMTQDELASKIGLSTRAYRGYVAEERPMQIPFQSWIARQMKAPRLAMEALASIEDNPFAPVAIEYDDHPAMQLCVAAEELREALEAITGIDPKRPDSAVVERAVQQIMDFSNVAAPCALIAFAEAWGVDLWAARRKHVAKLEARGYLRKEAQAA